ncbi:MAG: hypothetical protein CM15mP23_14530 [Cryomorphaceae bacterium]|nr:MAG: hypothetical protein CM15mP23_14530 [Cryomorphaceae bacterium]
MHFYTKTSIDTLDYSGEGLNTGSKLVIAAAGESIRTLIQDFEPEILCLMELPMLNSLLLEF